MGSERIPRVWRFVAALAIMQTAQRVAECASLTECALKLVFAVLVHQNLKRFWLPRLGTISEATRPLCPTCYGRR